MTFCKAMKDIFPRASNFNGQTIPSYDRGDLLTTLLHDGNDVVDIEHYAVAAHESYISHYLEIIFGA